MKNQIFTIVFLLLGLCAPLTNLWGSHMNGFDIGHEIVGPNQIKIKVRFVRDCSGIAMPFALNVNVFPTSTTSSNSPTVFQISQVGQVQYTLDICPSASNCLTTGVRSLEYQDFEGIYTIPRSLQNMPLTFSVADCCLSPFASNVFQNSNSGFYAETKYFPQAPFASFVNTTPLFLSQVKLLVKQGERTTFQLANFDKDGDSLVYSLQPSKNSVSVTNAYVPPMTYLQPLPNNSLILDSLSGKIIIDSTAPRGEYFVFFQCDEYRNGVLVGTSQYSRQIKVEPFVGQFPNPTTIVDSYFDEQGINIGNSFKTIQRLGDTTSREIGFVLSPCAGDSITFGLLVKNGAHYSFASNIDSTVGGQFYALPFLNNDDAFLFITIPNAPSSFSRFFIQGTSNTCIYQASVLLDFYITPGRYSTIIASDIASVCPSTSTTIHLSTLLNQPNSNYIWTPSNLFGGSQANTQTISVSQATDIFLEVPNSLGFCNYRDTFSIREVPTNISISEQAYCIGNPTTFTASPLLARGSYQWSPSSLFPGQNGSNVANGTLSQATNIGVTYTDIDGCTASGAILATYTPLTMTVTADQSLLCIGETVSLSARITGDTFPQAIDLDNYLVYPTSSVSVSNSGFTAVSLTDDSYSSAINLGFTFTFFGNSFTDCYIGSNGFITFGVGSSSLGNTALPSTNSTGNLVALCWDDLNPAQAGRISYSTIGSAPYRRFVVDYDGVARFGQGTTPLLSGQIILYEGSNEIELIITDMQITNSDATQGIQNADGTIGFATPDRNGTLWTASNSSYRYSNAPSNISYNYVWSNATGLYRYFRDATTQITSNTTYQVTATTPLGCTATGSVHADTRPRVSSSTSTNMTCGLPNGTATATGGLSYRWNTGAVTSQITGLSAGTYRVTITEVNGCDFIDELRVTNPYLNASATLALTQTSAIGCNPATVSFATNLNAQLSGTYTWLPSSVFGNQSGTNASATVTEPLNITVIFTDQGGCSVSRSILSNNSNNNLTISASANSVCTGGSVTLSSFRGGDSGIFHGGAYSVASIPHQPVTPLTPINCTLTSGGLDDGFSTVNLGFPFTYFGQTYTQAYVGTNGYLTFGSGSSSFYSSTIPNPLTPNNAIYLVWGDLIATTGSMRYEVMGTAPNRRFVLYFSNEDLFNNLIPQRGQLVLYEGTNEIDIINIDIDYGDNAVQGIENATGTYALPVLGRNFTTFIARNDAYRFTPLRDRDTITTAGYRYLWSGLSNGSANYFNNVTTIVNQNSVFTVTSYDSLGCAVTGTVSVNAIPRQSSISSTPETCGGQDGTATASGGIAYIWSNGSTSATVTGLPSGFTYITITEANGCVIRDSVFIASSLGAVWGISITNANCQTSDGTATVNPPSSGGPFSVNWSNGDTGYSISGLALGWYSATISNSSGCRSHRNFEIRENSNCFWRIEGYVYNDHVAPDCAPDAGSNYISNAIVQISDNSDNAIGYAVTDSTGFYSYDVRNAGRSYNLDYLVPNYANAIAACPNTLTVSITASQRLSTGNNFYVDFIESSDAEAVAYSPRMRTGINNPFTPFVQNMGNTPLSGTFTLTYSANLTYTGSQNGVIVNTNNRSITWPFSNLHVGSSQSFSSLFSPLLSAPAGAPFSLTGIVQINGTDNNPTNDTFRVDGFIVNSYDPNEKSVFPQGSGLEHGILESQRSLTYTIDFENLGNDTAYAVFIHDVIDTTKLDIRSVRPVASSHDFEMGIKGLDTLTFHSPNINLLARSQDPQKAKGFVAFSIDLKPGLPVGTRIENRASIFFDYNAAIVTNTAYNTIVRPSGIEAPTLSLSAKLFPNPTNANATLEIDLEEGTELRIAVLDMMGRAVGNSQQSTWLPEGRHQFALDSEQWPAGMYFVQLVTPKGVVALPMQVVR